MVQALSELKGKKVSILLPGGAKGIVKFKGIISDTNDDEGLITLETAGGMMGGKKKYIVFGIYSILGIEEEE
jgi:hypothetical protein